MRFFVIFLTLMITTGTGWTAEKIVVTASSKQGDASRLVDGRVDDQTAWTGRGVPITLNFNFLQTATPQKLRIYPGQRYAAAYPSTECGPSELIVLGWNGKIFQPLTGKVKIPRDNPDNDEFFVDIPLKNIRTDRIRLKLLGTHDSGRRVSSPDRVTVPLAKRGVAIREIKFFLKENIVPAEEMRQRARSLIADFRQRTGMKDSLAEALKKNYALRIKQLNKLLEDGKLPEVSRECDYLERHLSPWLGARLVVEGEDLFLELQIRNSTPEAIAAFPVNFALLEAAGNKKLSRFHVQVFRSGDSRPLNSRLDSVTPKRSVLNWALADTEKYRVEFAGVNAEGKIPLARAVGDGDHLMTEQTGQATMPYSIWSLVFADIFGDVNPAIVTGEFSDYAYIWRDLGKRKNDHLFSPDACYVVRDKYDEPIGTTGYHGRATAMAFPCDLDSDGRTDMILSRYAFYRVAAKSKAALPVFVRNLSDDPEEMKYADPVPLLTLKPGWHYTYADVDGDGKVDAVGALDEGSSMRLAFFRGKGPNELGVPVFAAPEKLNISIPKALPKRKGITVLLALDDLNKDQQPDLSVLTPPKVYIAYNRSRNGKVKFADPVVLKGPDGKPFNSGVYYPAIAWHDVNGDGSPDLLRTPGFNHYRTKGGNVGVVGPRIAMSWLHKQFRLRDLTEALTGYDIVDLDGDGDLEFCEVDRKMRLKQYKYRNGVFSKPKLIKLEPDNVERYGCPDSPEYAMLYCELEIADLDNDGQLDLLINSEHNWRFGYYSYYRNLGNGRFAPEDKIVPAPDNSHIRLENGLLKVDRKSILDYLSFETKDRLSPECGKIEFTYTPDKLKASQPRTLFSSGFWHSTAKLDHSGLRTLYNRAKSVDDLFTQIPYFALLLLPDGRLRCQFGRKSGVDSASPLSLKPGKLTRFELSYDKSGCTVRCDGKVVIRSSKRPERIAERLHLGSLGWHAVQRDREYPARWKAHPTDFSLPADGSFGEFNCFGADGKPTVKINFRKYQFGPLVPRCRISYRTTPAFTNYQGKPALVAHLGDHRREEKGNDKAVLHICPFTAEPGKKPRFGKSFPLKMSNGKPFYSFSRTQVVPVDWNGDGHEDLILSTAGFANRYHTGIELFVNDGKYNFTRTGNPALLRLNKLVAAHHDTKLVFAKLSGAAEPDIVVWSDPGLRVYRQAFLRQRPVEFKVETLTVPVDGRNLLSSKKWRAYKSGIGKVVIGKDGTIFCDEAGGGAKDASGVVQTVVLNQKNPKAVFISAECKAENVSGKKSRNFSIYIDIKHSDGSTTWNKGLDFTPGTYDWKKFSTTYVPEKPIKSINFYFLLRRENSGKAWFRNAVCKEIKN